MKEKSDASVKSRLRALVIRFVIRTIAGIETFENLESEWQLFSVEDR